MKLYAIVLRDRNAFIAGIDICPTDGATMELCLLMEDAVIMKNKKLAKATVKMLNALGSDPKLKFTVYKTSEAEVSGRLNPLTR